MASPSPSSASRRTISQAPTVAAPDFWFPLSLVPLIHPDGNWLRDRENQWCRLFARLAPGVTIGQAQAEMTAFANHLRTLHDPHSELSKPVTALVLAGLSVSP